MNLRKAISLTVSLLLTLGVITFTPNLKAYSSYLDDEYHEGTLTDGNTFKGFFNKAGYTNGYGTLIYKNKKTTTGVWKNGNFSRPLSKIESTLWGSSWQGKVKYFVMWGKTLMSNSVRAITVDFKRDRTFLTQTSEIFCGMPTIKYVINPTYLTIYTPKYDGAIDMQWKMDVKVINNNKIMLTFPRHSNNVYGETRKEFFDANLHVYWQIFKDEPIVLTRVKYTYKTSFINKMLPIKKTC